MGCPLGSYPHCVAIDSSAPRQQWQLSKARHASISSGCAPTSITRPARRSGPVAERRPGSQGLIDTSVVIDLDHLDAGRLPSELAISALTMAELAAGPHATGDTAGGGGRRES